MASVPCRMSLPRPTSPIDLIERGLELVPIPARPYRPAMPRVLHA